MIEPLVALVGILGLGLLVYGAILAAMAAKE
jgi:hypothetical protein